uniref:SDR family NAD(P)-dependent oxidoreductase n=1 Tax=Pseudarthrobacter sp. B4EP4b TaxID=2590664 RepID=UPI00115258A0
KWAVRGLTRSAAIELGPDKIRVNSIFPGPIDTPMLALNSDETNERLLSRNPSGRKGHPSEIAAATLFLASDAASYISGAELAVDGGSAA